MTWRAVYLRQSRARNGRRVLLFQFVENAAAMLKMLRLRGVEVVEQLPSLGRIVATAGKICDDQFLRRDMPLALGNVPFGFLEVSLEHRAIHQPA